MKSDYYKVRKLYTAYHNTDIPEGYHVHHIVPVHAGGTDDIDNLTLLTAQDHATAHKELYEKHGNVKDYMAYKMLSGFPAKEVLAEIASMGGKIGGMKTYVEKLGIHGAIKALKVEWGKKGGKAGGKRCKELKKGIHSELYQSKEWQSKTGTRNGKFVVEHYDWASVEKQKARGKKGGVKNKGFVWITDGNKQYKYTTKMQEELTIEMFLKQNENFRLGRK